VSNEIHSNSSDKSPIDPAEEIGCQAAEIAGETFSKAARATKALTSTVGGVAKEVTDTTRNAIHTAQHMYNSAALHAGDSLATTKEYVRRNPVPVVLGALAFGAAIGYLIVSPGENQTSVSSMQTSPWLLCGMLSSALWHLPRYRLKWDTIRLWRVLAKQGIKCTGQSLDGPLLPSPIMLVASGKPSNSGKP
jgi:hypothetical protein